MSRFAITMNDGSVAIMETIPQPMVRKRDGKTTMVASKPEAEISRWPEAERARVVSVTPIEDADIPSDRTFRNAWKLNGKRIDHDMEKARAIHMERIRRRRTARLRALDTEALIALGKGDSAAANDVEARKQALRDVPQNYEAAIAAASTVDALKAVWPSELA